jgi:hypothetical protein
MSLIGTIVGIVILAALSVFAVYFAAAVVTKPAALLGLMKLGLGLGLVLLVWASVFGSGSHK